MVGPCAARRPRMASSDSHGRPPRGTTCAHDAQPAGSPLTHATPFEPLDSVLPSGMRSRFVDGVNGLRMHVLEAGFETEGRPVVLLLHGFPELAWSWRKVMPALAAAGLHVVAPDQRGYGRTTGWDGAYDGELASFRPLNLVQDLMELV